MKIVTVGLCLCLVGCSIYKKDMTGTYEASGKDYLYRLTLQSDSTFTLLERVQDGRPQCRGVWNMVTENELLLNCSDTESLSDMLSNGYMTKRKHRIEVIGKRLFYKNTYLKPL